MSNLTKIYVSREEIPEPIGWNTEGKSYYIDGSTHIGQEGAIVLNNKYDNEAVGINSVAEGYDTLAFGNYSHAEGHYTKAKGDYSHAEGKTTKATGEKSHAEGNSTEASGLTSHAEGDDTKASGQAAHAEGSNSEATGAYSHAEGYNTEASGYASHSEGDNTKATDMYSHAEGLGTIATQECQHVQGKYNIEDPGYIHIVGNGISDSYRANVHTITYAGNAWFQGDVYTGSRTGQKDESSKKLATEEYVTNNAVSKSGDTMTGNLRVNKTSTSSDTANVTTVLTQTDTGDASEAAVIVGADRAALEYKRTDSSGTIKDHNWIAIYGKYAFSYWSPSVTGNESNHFLATTKAVADYAQPKAITTTTDPGDGATVDYPDGTVIYVYE